MSAVQICSPLPGKARARSGFCRIHSLFCQFGRPQHKNLLTFRPQLGILSKSQVAAMGMDQSPTRGEMFEWFMELVLKTSDAARHRGFESLSLRQNRLMEKYPRGRRGSPAKGVGWDNCREGSNPSFSATIRLKTIVFRRILPFPPFCTRQTIFTILAWQ